MHLRTGTTIFIKVEVPPPCHLRRTSEITSDFGDYPVIWDYYPKFARVTEGEYPLAQPSLAKICCVLTLRAAMVSTKAAPLLFPMLHRARRALRPRARRCLCFKHSKNPTNPHQLCSHLRFVKSFKYTA